MAFQPLGNSPGRDKVCTDLKSLLLRAFAVKELETHFRAGYTFRSDACTSAFAYDPDYCLPGDVKMDPEGFGPERAAVVGMLQSAFNCSPVGETVEVLRHIAIDTLGNNLWRAIEADLVADLAAFPGIIVAPAPLQAVCALAEAAQFLATNGNCGHGVIVGPYDWFIQLGTDYLIWDGSVHRDLTGNIVIPLSVDNATVYAFDSNVDIRATEIMVMDELSPSIRSVNDRVIRAEQIYTVAIDPCVVGSFAVSDCCPCATGGGGGGTQRALTCALDSVEICNDAGNPISVTVSNFPSNPEFDVELVTLCDDNGPFFRRFTYDEATGLPTTVVDTTLAGAPYVAVGTVVPCPESPADGDTELLEVCDAGNGNEPFVVVITFDSTGAIAGLSNLDYTGLPYVPVGPIVKCSNTPTPVTASRHFDVLPGTPWTPALVTGILTSVTYTILVGTATITDSSGVVIAALPAGLTATWENDLEQSLTGAPLSIDADPGSRVYVNWTEV